MLKNIFWTIAFLILAPSSFATELTTMPFVSKTASLYELKPSESPLALDKVTQLSSHFQSVTKQANEVMKKGHAESLLLIDHGKIIFEAYNEPITEKSLQWSASMSKSLTAYTIGSMFCQKKIADLDRPAANYANELSGTVFGNASIRQLLTMTSGMAAGLKTQTCSGGCQSEGEFVALTGRTISIIDFLKKVSTVENPPGKVFSYSSTDTLALGIVADANGNFLQNFDEFLWRNIGSESKGYWILDKESHAFTYAGMFATTRDWGRLAIYTMSLLKSENSCVRNFMKEATTTRVANHSVVGPTFKGYGYQTWTESKIANGRAYWWVGHGGQRIGVDPVSERILVVTASENTKGVIDYYRLFAEFQK
jgi:CubicO group peptidase (beta-lactamase class C family)